MAMVKLVSQGWLNDPRLAELFVTIEKAGGQARMAGGAVRNALWGLPVSDVDVATTLLPDTVMSTARRAGFGVHPTGIDHGTVTVVIDGLSVEVTTLRADVETDGRRAVVAFSDDWAVDAARRDFTFNALYCDLSGQVYDETGQGLADSAARRVRFVGRPDQRIREDYLRILRYFRFEAQYGNGKFDKDALQACGRLKDGLEGLSAERIQVELLKTLTASGALNAVKKMLDTGVLQQVVTPDDGGDKLARLITIEDHLDLAPDGLLRLAALTSDVMHLRLPNKMVKRFTNLIQPVDISAKTTTLTRQKTLYDLGHQGYRDRVMMAWAGTSVPPDDADWRQIYVLPDQWPVPQFPVTGKDMIAAGFSQGKAMGDALAQLERQWADGGFKEQKDDLLKKVMQQKNSIF